MKIKFGLLAVVGALASTCPMYGMKGDDEVAGLADLVANMSLAQDERVGIEQLSFMRLGGGFSAQVCGNVDLVRSGATSLWYNRAIVHGATVTAPAVKAVNDMMEGAPYGWWVHSSAQSSVSRELQEQGFGRYSGKSEHVMSVKLGFLSLINHCVDDPKITTFHEITVNSFTLADATPEQLELWIQTSAAGFGLDVSALRTFIEYIAGHASATRVTLFLATLTAGSPELTLNGVIQPSSSCMTIVHADGTVTLHQLSTIPAFRCHGLGHEIVREALRSAYVSGVGQNALVLSSPEANKLFKSFGFVDRERYDVYVKLADAKASLPQASSGYCLVS
jgi:ribosomal protein S18 acetylase RimI-like enzyme